MNSLAFQLGGLAASELLLIVIVSLLNVIFWGMLIYLAARLLPVSQEMRFNARFVLSR